MDLKATSPPIQTQQTGDVMARQQRFTSSNNIRKTSAYRTIREHKRHMRQDATRSFRAADGELRRLSETSRLKPTFHGFEKCIGEAGYTDVIGFHCGRHQESAACSKCRLVALTRIIDLLSNRAYFVEQTRWLTLVDTEGLIPTGKLSNYAPASFKQRLNSIAKETSEPLQAIGIIEFEIKDGRLPGFAAGHWTPHLHAIASGPGAREFEKKLRDRFNLPNYKGDVLRVKPITDRNGMFRAACYMMKSIFKNDQELLRQTRLTDSQALQKIEEIAEFLVDKNLSDLVWTRG